MAQVMMGALTKDHLNSSKYIYRPKEVERAVTLLYINLGIGLLSLIVGAAMFGQKLSSRIPAEESFKNEHPDLSKVWQHHFKYGD